MPDARQLCHPPVGSVRPMPARRRFLGSLLPWAAALAACNPLEQFRLPDFRSLGELRVAMRHDALAYRAEDNGEMRGFEHDLLIELGRRLGVPVRFDTYPDGSKAIQAVLRGEAHMAAAGLARDDRLPLRWSPALRQIDFVLVGRDTGEDQPPSLAGRHVGVRKGTPAENWLKTQVDPAQGMRVRHPQRAGEGDLHMLEMVADGRLDFAITDRLHFELASHYHPDIRVLQALPVQAPLAWAMPVQGDDTLASEVTAFLRDPDTQALLARLADRYFGHIERLSEADVSRFIGAIAQTLPALRRHFQAAQAATDIDWRLLAALAYQESHWDPLATSPSGVRGIMMLTTDTADRLGVADRLDARASILGGARYLALLRDQLPTLVPEPDRTWMALAAYNIGQGHFNAARRLARQLKRDEASWLDMKGVLPMLSRPEYAERLKSGPARGGQAVLMAENVRIYYDILRRFESAYSPPLAPDLQGLPRLRAGG